jgi:hypothetical protein
MNRIMNIKVYNRCVVYICRTKYIITVNNLYIRMHRIDYNSQVSVTAHVLLLKISNKGHY